MAAGTEGCTAARDLGCLSGSLCPGSVCPRLSTNLQCAVGGTRERCWEANGCMLLRVGAIVAATLSPWSVSCRFPGPGWPGSCPGCGGVSRASVLHRLESVGVVAATRRKLSILATGKSVCAHSFKVKSRLEASVCPNGSPPESKGAYLLCTGP